MFHCHRNSYGQRQLNMNHHRHNSGYGHTVAQDPCHGGGAVQLHSIHKTEWQNTCLFPQNKTEVFEEVDGGYGPRHHHQQQQVHHNGYGGGGHHRQEVCEDVGYNGRPHGGGGHRHEAYGNDCEDVGHGRYEACEKTCEEGYSGRHGGSQRYEVYETTCEEEVVRVSGGGHAQAHRAY